MPPALKALLAQLLGWAAAYAIARAGWLPAGIWPLAATQATAAGAAALALRSAPWWLPIHLVFTPLLVLAQRPGVAPGWYLGGFAVLVALYWSSFRTQVPLYLTNRRTLATLAALLPPDRALRVLDLGSGTGTLPAVLGRQHPDWRIEGLELAPGPWLIGRWRTRRLPNVSLRRTDFFSVRWSEYDVVYAFLSPVPMAAVWEKAQAELPAGALLVSNSFPVPGRKPDQVVTVADRRATRLYVYRIARGVDAKTK